MFALLGATEREIKREREREGETERVHDNEESVKMRCNGLRLPKQRSKYIEKTIF
jgi:hypothetical protein